MNIGAIQKKNRLITTTLRMGVIGEKGMSEFQRIEYIDLIKGFGILLVLMLHCSIIGNTSKIGIMMGAIRIPVFFVLSGFLFKTYNWNIFIKKKINNLLIPFLFFSFLYWCVGCFICFITNEKLFSGVNITNIFQQNFPLWFLKSLFFANVMYYVICKMTNGVIVQTTICFICLLGGIRFGKSSSLCIQQINDLLCLSNAMIGLFFIHLGYLLKMNKAILRIYSCRTSILIIMILLIILYLFSKEPIDPFDKKYNSDYFTFIVASSSGVLLTFLISKYVNRMRILSYLGRYSLIILGTHIIITQTLGPVLYYFISNSFIRGYLLLLVIILCMKLGLVSVLIKYCPRLVGQGNLLQ